MKLAGKADPGQLHAGLHAGPHHPIQADCMRLQRLHGLVLPVVCLC